MSHRDKFCFINKPIFKNFAMIFPLKFLTNFDICNKLSLSERALHRPGPWKRHVREHLDHRAAAVRESHGIVLILSIRGYGLKYILGIFKNRLMLFLILNKRR